MKPEIRAIGPEELEHFLRPGMHDFTFEMTDEDMKHYRAQAEWDRTLAAFDGSKLVGTAAAISYRMTLPGGTTVPTAGVTIVSVVPTHRRRGILTSFMRRQLQDVRARGEPLAILHASESVIYGRFGYAPCTTQVQWEIDRRFGALAHPYRTAGDLTMVEGDEAGTILPGIYERASRVYPGSVSRAELWWPDWLRDPAAQREGASRRYYVVHTSQGGEPDGYVAYRIKESWPDGLPSNTMIVKELMPATAEAYTALWDYCLGLDLVGVVQAINRPPDEPVRWMLADSRRLRVTQWTDGLWVRLADIVAALEARRYRMDGSVVIEVTDAFIPENAGRYELIGGADGATCRRTEAPCDIVLDITDLGAAYLGNVSLSVLRRAGRVREETAGALARADAMFASEPAPWCATFF